MLQRRTQFDYLHLILTLAYRVTIFLNRFWSPRGKNTPTIFVQLYMYNYTIYTNIQLYTTIYNYMQLYCSILQYIIYYILYYCTYYNTYYTYILYILYYTILYILYHTILYILYYSILLYTILYTIIYNYRLLVQPAPIDAQQIQRRNVVNTTRVHVKTTRNVNTNALNATATVSCGWRACSQNTCILFILLSFPLC